MSKRLNQHLSKTDKIGTLEASERDKLKPHHEQTAFLRFGGLLQSLPLNPQHTP